MGTRYTSPSKTRAVSCFALDCLALRGKGRIRVYKVVKGTIWSRKRHCNVQGVYNLVHASLFAAAKLYRPSANRFAAVSSAHLQWPSFTGQVPLPSGFVPSLRPWK